VISCRNTICDFLDDRNVGEKELNEDLRDQEKGGGKLQEVKREETIA